MEQLAAVMQGFVSLLARLSLAAIFLASALGNKIPQFKATAEYMKAEGVPNATFALFGAIGLLLLGGLSLVVGAWTRIGAFFLLVFLAAATYYFHDFWQFADPLQRQLQTIQFMKNLAIGGGLLALIAFGAGPWSVDGWIGRRQSEVESEAPTTKPRTTAKPIA
ncbi:MAG: DoxX family protein [Planctomycetota bacterium]|nr:MAG: DoxX family protein [Planctomycetota bacterium]